MKACPESHFATEADASPVAAPPQDKFGEAVKRAEDALSDAIRAALESTMPHRFVRANALAQIAIQVARQRGKRAGELQPNRFGGGLGLIGPNPIRLGGIGGGEIDADFADDDERADDGQAVYTDHGDMTRQTLSAALQTARCQERAAQAAELRDLLASQGHMKGAAKKALQPRIDALIAAQTERDADAAAMRATTAPPISVHRGVQPAPAPLGMFDVDPRQVPGYVPRAIGRLR